MGIKPSQIILGIPTYGRLVAVSGAGTTHGLYQPITGTPKGEYDDTGVFDYRCIVSHDDCYGSSATLLSNLSIYTKTPLNRFSHTPFAFDATRNNILTYDDADAASFKTNWAKSQSLAGVMYWSYSGDLPATADNSLIHRSYLALK